MKNLIQQQFYVLLLGTVFAWVNFAIEMKNWLNDTVCPLGCSGGVANPFLTPCFYGALFFAIAFIYNLVIRNKFFNKE